MKLLSFRHQESDEPRLGILTENESVLDLAAASQGQLPSTMREFLSASESALAVARGLDIDAGPAYPLADVKLLSPISNPSKIVAIGLNYMDHCREQGHKPPEKPIIFTKFSTAIVGPNDAIQWDPALTGQVDYEVELAVVIGREARHVSSSDALDYVAGYTVCNDVSARDLQFGDGQWIRGKSLDTFCPLGPCLVTTDEIPDPQNLWLKTTLNGRVVQDSSTAEMIFGVADLIAFSSNAFTLLPGDVLITGTPHGVGVFCDPQIFMHNGDVITVEIEGIGALTNSCVEDA